MNSNQRDFRPAASLAVLEQRAALLVRLREFFHNREFIEVETPLVSPEIIPELHIEPMRTAEGAFLQASPELHMKRLLAAGLTAIFQVTRSFRAGERGPLHNPEFTIVEWYRTGDNMAAGIDVLDELMQSLLGTSPAARTTYSEAFQRHAGICPHTATIEELAATTTGLFPSPLRGGLWRAQPSGVRGGAEQPETQNTFDRDELLDLLLATRVESNLGRDRPEIIYHYPASQASLAKVVRSDLGYDVAERFELYFRGVELANGFHELTDAAELRLRLENVNAARVASGRPALPLPESLLAAMERGLPASTGVALGVDRLAMLAAGAATIADVMAFADE